MNAKARGVPEINLDEFERRLRSAGSSNGTVEDPLAELTRLVNSMAAGEQVDGVFDFSGAKPPRRETSVPPPMASEPPTPDAHSPVGSPSNQFFHDGIEEQLRRAIEEPTDDGAGYGFTPNAPLGTETPVEARPAKSASWYVKVSGLAGLGVLMLVGAVAFKFVGVPGLPKAPPVIHAADGPVKVAPPNEAAVQSPGDSGSLLTSDSTSSAPVKIVTHEEQPIDLASRAPASQVAAASPSPSTSPVAPNTDAPLVAPADNLSVAPVATQPTSTAPTAKGLRTVSVRPDGSLIAVNAVPVAAAVSQPPSVSPTQQTGSHTSDPSGAAAIQPSTPIVDLPPAKPTQKSSARVTASKTDTTVPAEPAGVPLQLNSASKPAKPLPTKLSPPSLTAPSTPSAATADATALDAPAAPATAPAAEPIAGGGWSVQLSAPRSDAEAQGQITRLQSKYANELGGSPLGVHKAEVNGETIYRVRVSGLSKADAAAMCSKIKAGGGDCFVARN